MMFFSILFCVTSACTDTNVRNTVMFVAVMLMVINSKSAFVFVFAAGCPVLLFLGCTYSGNAPSRSRVRSLVCS